MNFDFSKQQLLRLGEVVFTGAFVVLLIATIGIFTYYGLYRPRFPDLQHDFSVPIKTFAGHFYITKYEANLEYYMLLSCFLCAVLGKACEIHRKK